jgi:glycine/D-amino acid oxidase-like deaminating enzyme
MTRYGRSPWIDRFPKSRVPSYPRHRGLLRTDVAIVGGGLTGCATAHGFAAAGIRVVLVESGLIGQGTTAAAAGWISDDPGVPFADVEKLLGLRMARQAFQAWRRAALDFSTLLRRLSIKCSLEPRAALTVAFTPEQIVRLRREQKTRKDAGLDAPVLNARVISGEVGLGASLAIRSRDGATLDPYRACLGLAAAAVNRGAQFFERSPATRTRFGRKWVEVHTAGGPIRARRVVVATGVPTRLFQSLARHFWFRSAYLALTEPVPAKIRQQLGKRATVVRDAAEPPHIVRWMDDERLLVTGADAESPPDRQREKKIIQRTGQLMYELSTLYPDISGILPEYGWEAPYARTTEGLPYIGPHRNFPHHLFVFGDSSHNATGAYLASRLLLRHYLDELEPADQAFAFTR